MAEEPSPLLPYKFDPSLSEDENFLTWATVQARMSVSKKGHMGTIFVRPPGPDEPHPAWVPSPDRAQWDDKWRRADSASSRVVLHGNNLPSLYGSPDKMVSEIHAEASCISRAARRGIALEGLTCYVTFPPCNDCFKLLAAAGIKRCVFRKGLTMPNGEAVLVAAQVYGVDMRSTTLTSTTALIGWEVDENGVPLNARVLGDTCDEVERDAYLDTHRAAEKDTDIARENRARLAWIAAEETTERTRARVKDWWDNYHAKFQKARDEVVAVHGQGQSKKQLQQKKSNAGTSRQEDRTGLEEEAANEGEALAQGKSKKRKLNGRGGAAQQSTSHPASISHNEQAAEAIAIDGLDDKAISAASQQATSTTSGNPVTAASSSVKPHHSAAPDPSSEAHTGSDGVQSFVTAQSSQVGT